MNSTDNNSYYPNLREQTTRAGNSPDYNNGNARARNGQYTLAAQRPRVPRLSGENTQCIFNDSDQLLSSQSPDPRVYINTSALFENPSQEQTTAHNQLSYTLDSNSAGNNIFPAQTTQSNLGSVFNPNDPTQNASPSQSSPTGGYLGPHQYCQPQNAQRAFDITQTELQQQMNEHVSDHRSNVPNSASAALNADLSVSSAYLPSLSMNKRRKLEDLPTSDVYYGAGADNPSTNEYSPRLYDDDITLLCCVWCVANPGRKPDDSDYAVISGICNASGDAAKDIFDRFQSHDIRPGQNSPDRISSSVLNIWHRKNPGKTLSDWLLVGVAKVFHGQLESLRRLAARNAMSPSTMRDSAMGKSLRTSVSSVNQAPSHTEDSQIWCKSIAKKGSGKLKPRHEWKFDPQRKYLCPDCGQNFPRKGDWKRHITRNSQTEIWSCTICQSTKPWSRKDQLIEHIEKDHTSECDEPIELRGTLSYNNFKKQCMFRDSNVTFNSFRESKDHIAGCFEERDQWDYRDLRCDEEEESVLRAMVDVIENSLSERRDDDEPGGSARENPGDASGGNNSSLAPGSSASPSRPSPSQGSRGGGASSHAGHSFGRSGQPSSASDKISVLKKFPSESILWEILSQSKQIWSSQLHVLGRLGSGGRAVVDEVWINGFTRTLALKTFKSSLQDPLREWRREIEILAKLKEHPHIVKLVHIYIQHGFSALLIQPVADYDLDKYLGSYSATLKEQRNIWLWFSCLASGLKFLHEKGVIHHDIKPQNILVKDQIVLFADFGSSCTVDETRLLENEAFHHTKLYAAPEVERGDFMTASDVFSLGCVFLEMVTVLISSDMWKQLRALQSSFYHQEVSTRHWALEWIEQIRLHSSTEASGNQYGPILEVCRQMTQLEKEKRPNAANIYTQINLSLRRQCDYGMPSTCHPDRSLSRKRPNQEAEAQSKRPPNLFKVKTAEKMTDVATQPSHPIVCVSCDASASKVSIDWKRPVQKIGRRWKTPEKINNVEEADAMCDVASHLSGLTVSKSSSTSASTATNRTKSCEYYTSQFRDMRTKMLDRFINDRNTLGDAIVSGCSRYNEYEGTIQHTSIHQKFGALIGLKATSPTSSRKISMTRSLPSSTEYAVVTKTSKKKFWNSRGFPNYSSSHQTKDIGSQFYISV